MSDLPLMTILIVFSLGFLAGIILTSLFHEIRRREPPSRSQERSSEHPDALNKLEPSTEPAQHSAEAQANSLVNPEISGIASTLSAQKKPVEWVPGPWDTQPQKVSMNPVEAIIRGVQSNPGIEKPKQVSMAEEIDDILQGKLALSEQAGRTIRLHVLADQSLEVIVDGNRFNGVGEVTDLAARALIQSAVEEWQRRIYYRDI
jgi:hypothetical protein